MAALALTSTAFEDGEATPRRHTCDGDDLSPPLAWGGQPPETQSLALVVDDPDAPGGTFTHWLAWGFDAATSELAEGEAAPTEGRNDFGANGYRGPGSACRWAQTRSSRAARSRSNSHSSRRASGAASGRWTRIEPCGWQAIRAAGAILGAAASRRHAAAWSRRSSS